MFITLTKSNTNFETSIRVRDIKRFSSVTFNNEVNDKKGIPKTETIITYITGNSCLYVNETVDEVNKLINDAENEFFNRVKTLPNTVLNIGNYL